MLKEQEITSREAILVVEEDTAIQKVLEAPFVIDFTFPLNLTKLKKLKKKWNLK